MVAPPGLEPGSEGPKPPMLDHYTTGLSLFLFNWVSSRVEQVTVLKLF